MSNAKSEDNRAASSKKLLTVFGHEYAENGLARSYAIARQERQRDRGGREAAQDLDR